MKNIFKRVLLTAMVLLLAVGAVMPAAMAAEVEVASNASSVSLYAGNQTTLYVTLNGVQQSPSNYKWKSSKSSVVSVNSKGVITGKKVGSATITATRKSNGARVTCKVTVKRNKVDYLNSKPAATAAPYKGVVFRLKSVEIASPTKVVAEYYVACNFPSSWKASKVNYVQDAINLFDRYSGAYKKTIVGDDYQLTSKSISGFKARKGKSVQTIKVTYTGSRVNCSNIVLSDYKVSNSSNARIGIRYYY